MTSASTVFVVDDDAAIRDSLQILLSNAGLNVSGYDSGIGFLQDFDAGMQGCLLLDVRMPHMDGLELLSALQAKKCRMPVIIMTAHGEVKIAVQAMKLGASDFIEKPFQGDVLINTIRSALEQNARSLTDEQAVNGFMDNIAGLTERERQVFDLVVQCDSNKVIASKLNISPRTVEIHRARIMDKLQVRNLSQLLKMATLTGYI